MKQSLECHVEGGGYETLQKFVEKVMRLR